MALGWSPLVGGLTFPGWFAVAAYFGASWLCYRNYALSALPPGTGDLTISQSRVRRCVWLAICVMLLALGIDKQFDLQSLVTGIGREVAMRQGWYEARRGPQREFVTAIALLGIAGTAALPLLARRAGGWAMLAAAGLTALVAYLAIRAASLHDIDAVMDSGWAGVRLNQVIELGGIAIVGLSALGFRWSIGGKMPGVRRIGR